MRVLLLTCRAALHTWLPTRFLALPHQCHPCPAPVPTQVFVTAQARCLDLASVYAQGSGALVVVSPGTKAALLERLDKHIFPNDRVGCFLG